MKNRIGQSTRRAGSAGISLLLVFSLLCGAVIFAGAQGEPVSVFLGAVGAINEKAPYADRVRAKDAALAAYGKLTSGEREADGVPEAYAKLEGECGALEAFKNNAEAFLLLIASLSDAVGVSQKKAILDSAASLACPDESYPGLAEAYAVYLSESASVGATCRACDAFIEAIGKAAEDLDLGEGYRTVKKNYDLAETYKNDTDPDYPGMESALGAEKAISMALFETREVNETFLDSVARMNAATGYEELSDRLESAKRNYEEIEDFDYDGIEEALEDMENAQRSLASRMESAVAYIELASKVSLAGNEDRAEAYAAAREAEKTADLTVSAARSAKEGLDRYAEEYDKAAAAANAVADFWLLAAIGMTN